MKNKFLLVTILFLFGLFLVLYFSQATGYYEYKNSKSKNLTEESIKKFEEDLKLGKKINVNNYKVEELNNSNKISNNVFKTSKFLEKSCSRIISYFFRKLSSVIVDT